MRHGAVTADREALRRLSGACALCLIGAIALGNLLSGLLARALDAEAAQLLGAAAGLLVPFWLLARRFPAERPVSRAARAPLWALLLLFLGAVGGGSLLSLGLRRALSLLGFGGRAITMPAGRASLLFSAVNTVLAAPILEEWAFRGVCFGALRRFGDRFALIASSALFALLHVAPERWPLAFFSGLALAFCAQQTGNLRLSLALHIGYNACGLALLLGGRALPLLAHAAAVLPALPALSAARPFFPDYEGPQPYRTFFLTPALLLVGVCILFLGVTA